MISKTISAAILAVSICSGLASADPLYRWTDQQGNVHFSTKKPEDAVKVDTFSGGVISRYSSKLKNKNIQAVFDAKKLPAARSFSSEKAMAKLRPPEPEPAGLTQQELKIEHGPQGEITDCRLTLWNNSAQPAQGVSVVFKFGEGTALEAQGPVEIAPQAKVEYSMLGEYLPIVLPGGVGSTPEVVVTQK